MKKKQIHIFLEDWRYEEVKKASKINEKSVSQVIREIITANINGYKRKERLIRARMLGTHTEKEWLNLLNYIGDKCAKCGKKEYEKDHIIPIYQGGSDGIENLQPLCKTCNTSKGPDNTNYIKKENPHY